MSLAVKLRRAPGRIATGAFILNTGLDKLRADEQTAKALHTMAADAYPVFAKLEPKKFLKMLAVGEVALGSTLLLPLMPSAVAGLGLAAFSGSLLGMWWRTPGMHEPGSPRPTHQGIPLAKDVWMFGIGTGLVVDAATSRTKG
jgi:uncharacterized membrane protein YphA (DoxX/SURF4 family)